jgi:hypothetical protein
VDKEPDRDDLIGQLVRSRSVDHADRHVGQHDIGKKIHEITALERSFRAWDAKRPQASLRPYERRPRG